MNQFHQSRLKIERANQHIADIERLLTDLPNSYVSSVEVDPDARYKSIKHDVINKRFMSDAALMIGDAVHNLKCALDYAWIKTVERVAPLALGKFAKFPVYATREALEAALRGRKIDVASPALFSLMLDEIHPYDGGNFAIWPIYVLDKRDKHRLLIPIIQYSSISGVEVEDEAGVLHRGDTWGTTKAPPYYIDFKYELNIKNKGKLTLNITFDNTLIEYAPRVEGTLSIYSRFILQIVETLESFLQTV